MLRAFALFAPNSNRFLPWQMAAIIVPSAILFASAPSFAEQPNRPISKLALQEDPPIPGPTLAPEKPPEAAPEPQPAVPVPHAVPANPLPPMIQVTPRGATLPEQAPMPPSETSPAPVAGPPNFGILIIPGPSSSATVNGKNYEDIYRSIPFRRSEYLANPSYRHEATLEIMFGQLRPTTIHKQDTPQRVPDPLGRDNVQAPRAVPFQSPYHPGFGLATGGSSYFGAPYFGAPIWYPSPYHVIPYGLIRYRPVTFQYLRPTGS